MSGAADGSANLQSGDSGLDGVVCSPREIAALKAACGPDFVLMVPGIRPNWAASGDQKRVMTPAEALAAGADYLVIGRPVTGAQDAAAAPKMPPPRPSESSKRSRAEKLHRLSTAALWYYTNLH